jgi:hypothetical protein
LRLRKLVYRSKATAHQQRVRLSPALNEERFFVFSAPAQKKMIITNRKLLKQPGTHLQKQT